MDELLKKSGYSEKAIRYYKNKTNVGIIKNPTVSFTYKGQCGDTMKIYLMIESKIIVDAKFEAIGCAGAFTAGSALMELLKNKNVAEARNICEYDIVNHLGSVPEKKQDCIYLAIKTLQKTLNSMKGRKNIKK
ncbi:MAG: iron-sulfur cluster assembly scaffold protein [Candidatus Marinimicrobia bacterium]|nr:iron-sulfur cluster assembly scaffold protein [Candidatus Neomarinimicrobiota bacterium]